MEEFLRQTKQILESKDFSAVHIILGNEACDLDSAISAVVYAYFLSKVHNDAFYLPILDIPSSDFPLRTETVFTFRKHSITPEVLTFSNQVNLAEWTAEKDVKITLVDHNVLKENYKEFESLVVEVIDHRVLEREPSDSCDMTVEMVGSCSTLIAEKIFADTEFEMTAELAELLYGTILVDTVCLAESAGRAAPKDFDMVDKIATKLPQSDRKAIFDEIIAAKNDIAALSTNDLLLKDLKNLQMDELNIAFCSLPCHINDFLARENVDGDLMTFEEQQRASAIVLMCLIVDENSEPQRQIAVHAKDSSIEQKVLTALGQCTQPTLLLSDDVQRPSEHLSVCAQGNARASRKLLLTQLQTHLTRPTCEEEEAEVPVLKEDPSADLLGDLDPFAPTDNQEVDVDLLQDPFANHSSILLEQSPLATPDLTTPDPSCTPEQGTSYPSTPPNSYMDGTASNGKNGMSVDLLTQLGDLNATTTDSETLVPNNSSANFMDLGRETSLPSFNNSEMVKTIYKKREDFAGDEEEKEEEGEAESGGRPDRYPFTPQNSITDGDGFRHSGLPSFHSSDMVESIRNKRASLGDAMNPEAEEEVQPEEADTFPFTPKNSHTDLFLHGDQKNHDLPSFHNSEMVRKIERRRSEDFGMESEVSEANTFPFAPPNSFVERQLSGPQMTQNTLEKVRDKVSDAESIDSSAAVRDDCGASPEEEDSSLNEIAEIAAPSPDEMDDNQSQEFVLAEQITSEIIGKALETCIEQDKELLDQEKEVLAELDSAINSADELDKDDDDDEEMEVETEYLAGVDPLRGSLDIATVVNKDLAESESFNRSSELTDDDVIPEGSSSEQVEVASELVDQSIQAAVKLYSEEKEEETQSKSEDVSPKSDLRKKIQATPDAQVSPMRTVTLHTAPEDHFDREEDSIQAEKATVKRMPSAEGTPLSDEEVPKWQRDLGVDLENDDEDEDDDEGLPDVIRMNVMGSKPKEDERASRDSSQSDSDSGPKKKIVPIMNDLLRDDDEMNDTISLESGDVDLIATGTVSLEGEVTPENLETPDAAHHFGGGGLEWESQSPVSPVEMIPEYSAREELEDNRNWRTVDIGQCSYRIDMKVIEPYKKVLSHGGYYGDGFNALVIFAACHLPDRSRKDYQYVMDNLFLYVISTLELLVVEDYMIIYFHGSTPKQKMPGLRWLKRCYDMIDRRLRKNLKGLLIVHPTLWLKTVVMMTRPFISSKFSSKLHYVKTLRDLSNMVPTEYIFIPDEIKAYDTLHCKSSNPVTPP